MGIFVCLVSKETFFTGLRREKDAMVRKKQHDYRSYWKTNDILRGMYINNIK